MIATVASSSVQYHHTVNTLKYADRAKEIKTHVRQNAGTVQEHIAQYQAIIDDLKEENDQLKRELNTLQVSSALSVCRHCSMQAVEDEQHFLLDCPFYSIIRGQHFSLFGPNYQQRDIRLFFEQNSHQLGFVAHQIHLCFQARMSDEPQLAPHPRL